MTAGRKPHAEIVDTTSTTLDPSKVTGALVQLRADTVAEKQAHETGLFDLGRQVGAIQMAHVQRSFLRAAEIRLFEEIKESKKYKHLALPDADGNLRTAETIGDFCKYVFGLSYSVMAEESQNLQLLGEDSYESANRLGLNRRQLRLIRSLPDAQRTAVQEAIQAESKADVVAIIEDLAAQLAQSHADMADAQAKATDDKGLIADKDARINHLGQQLKRIEAAPPEEQLALVLAEVTTRAHTAIAYVRGDLGLAFSSLSGFEKAGSSSHRHTMAGWLGDLEREIAILRADYHLPAPSAV